MIKVEVVFDGDKITVNGCVVCGCDESKKYWNVEKKTGLGENSLQLRMP